MLDVFFTVDVEVWCGGWANLDARFPAAFQRYVYGQTRRGEVGLRFQMQRLRDAGLTGVFFVEPLFALKFGIEPLAEIVGLVKEYGQELQLHMHPEWIDEASERLFPHVTQKRGMMRQFSVEEQTTLIAKGIELIERAGGERPNAFRAGSFGFNMDTIRALEANGILIDASYNATMGAPESGVRPGEVMVEPFSIGNVAEYPMTLFSDGLSKLRHTQVGAISSAEMEAMLAQAADEERSAFVILFHNFELLNQSRTEADLTVLRRFEKLCDHFASHRDRLNVRGFRAMVPKLVATQPAPLSSHALRTGWRMIEQVMRRRFD